MPRPRKRRRVGWRPLYNSFGPPGLWRQGLERIGLTVDELEALRLADLMGLSQEEAAARMNISRATFGRIVGEARKKVAQALINGKALSIQGGNYEVAMRRFRCGGCGHSWEVPYGTPRPATCPNCGGTFIRRAGEDRGYARGGGRAGFGRNARE
jgi:predicted DNA-binding protein (UPF0251 family)